MGPRPIGRGNPAAFAGRTSQCWLQWGRDRSVAEIELLSPGLGRGRRRFNGAATDRTRKFAGEVKVKDDGWRASMGPRPIGRGNAGERGASAAPREASMGPRPIGRGNSCGSRVPREGQTRLQWGRDRSVAEIRAGAHATDRGRRASMGPRPIGRGNCLLLLVELLE